jgi:hypothetical protein
VAQEPVAREHRNELERARFLEQVARPLHDLQPRDCGESGA